MQLKRTTLLNRLKARSTSLFFTLISILLTMGALGYLVYRERAMLFDYAWRIYPGPVLLAGLLYMLAVLVGALVWGTIMNRLGCQIPLLQHYRYYCLSNVAKRIPGTIWYIASRATSYVQNGVDVKLTSLASGMEFALHLISAILTSLVFSLPILASHNVPPWVLGLTFLAALTFVHPRVMGYFFRLLKVEASIFDFKDILAWTAGYTVLWLLGGILLFVTVRIIYPLPLHNLGYTIGVWALVGLVSNLLLLSPTNFGITEIGLSLLLSSIMPAPIAVATAVASRVLTTLVDLLTAALWMAFTGHSSH